MRRADRLMKVVHFLRRRRRAVTAARIGEEFGICTRTVYRDIQDLMDSGVPIVGEAGVGYLIDKQYFMPPVAFDKDELEAIGLGISMVRQWTDDRFASKADSAFEKIQAVLPASLQGELSQITTYATSSEPALPWSVSFSDLRESIRANRKVKIDYCDDGKRNTRRVLRPLAMIFTSPVWLLAGWCEKRKDFRHFRLDRIQSIEYGDVEFSNEGESSLATYLARESACRTDLNV